MFGCIKCSISKGDSLVLKEEPDNKHDANAIMIQTENGNKIGYVPRYYNKSIIAKLKNGMSYSCEIVELYCSGNCSECVKVKLSMLNNLGR